MTSIAEKDTVTGVLNGADEFDTAPVSFKRMRVCLDALDHANRALQEAVRLAGSADGVVSGIHAYAAKLHDHR